MRFERLGRSDVNFVLTSRFFHFVNIANMKGGMRVKDKAKLRKVDFVDGRDGVRIPFNGAISP